MERILKYFKYEHLPLDLQDVSEPFCNLANSMASRLPPSAELTAGLRKLLEAKDCIVRAALDLRDTVTVITKDEPKKETI